MNSLKLLLPSVCFSDKPQINSCITSELLTLRFTASSISIFYLDTLEEKPSFSFHICRQQCWTPSSKCQKALLLRKPMKYYKALGLTIWKFDPKMPLLRWYNMLHIISNNKSFTLRLAFILSQFIYFMIGKKEKSVLVKEHLCI